MKPETVIGRDAFVRAAKLALLPLFALLFLPACGAAQGAALRGYDGEGYQYVAFGEYPYAEDGAAAPVLWRVLGPGTPELEDIGHASDSALDNDLKTGLRGDALEGENADLYCLMTEYIVDVALYNETRDEPGGPPLDYEDSAMNAWLNGEMLGALFTPEQQQALSQMPGRGLISLPSRRGELHRPDYGFATADFGELPRRRTTGTPYAYSRGLARVNGYAWYYTTDWRRCGYRWIVGDNGHCSVAGVDRVGGVRLVCYVHADRLLFVGGSGTKEDPYALAVRDGLE